MAKNPIEKVEIVEPPIGELSKKHPWRRSCFSGCLWLILSVILIILGIRLYLGSGPKVLTSVPENFPTTIPLYDKENIDRITFIPGQYRNRAIAIAAALPRLVLSPTFFNEQGEQSADSQTGFVNVVKNLWNTLASQTEPHDTIRLEWKTLSTDPAFIANYYRSELRKTSATTKDEINTSRNVQFSFTTPQNIEGTLTIHGDPTKQPSTDYMILTVILPSS